MAKKKKPTKKKPVIIEPVFMLVDLNDMEVVRLTRDKREIEESVKAEMSEHDVDEDEAEERYTVFEISRQFRVEPQREYDIYLNPKDKIDIQDE